MHGIGKKHLRHFRCGLTLIELLIVIGIIAVLVGIVWVVFAPAKEKARISHCVSNLRQIYIAIQDYREDWEGADISTARSLADYGLPPNVYIVIGEWPFTKVQWLLGTQEVWDCPEITKIFYGGAEVDYWYFGNPFSKQFNETFLLMREEFPIVVDLNHLVYTGDSDLPRRLSITLRLNGQVRQKIIRGASKSGNPLLEY